MPNNPGAAQIRDPIFAKYVALGLSDGLLGAPRSEEVFCPDGVGRFQLYENGSIYWSPKTGAHEIHGDIRELWASIGWERSLLGYPSTDETATPDGIGRFNHFEGGSIYWTPSTQAHEVHGDIRQAWAASQWERGVLGYPVTSEFRTFDLVNANTPGDGHRFRISTFERGFIVFNEEDRSTRVFAPAQSYKGVTLMVTPIFWGKGWDPVNPAYPGQSWNDVDKALDSVLSAGVANGLQSYGIAHVVKSRATWMTDKPVPPNFPLSQGGFTYDELQDGLLDAVFTYGAPSPMHSKCFFDGLPPLTSILSVYVMFLPSGTRRKGVPQYNGEHINFGGTDGATALSGRFIEPEGYVAPGDGIKVCWVAQTAGALSNTLKDTIHEIVEAADDAAGREIGDRCQAGNGQNVDGAGFDALVGPVTLRSYWSNFHNRCILPPARDPVTNQAALQ